MNNRARIMMRINRRNWDGITATFVTIAGAAVFLVHLAMPAFAFGPEDIAVTPAVVDISGMPRDIIQREITVTNIGNSRLHLYPTVRNLTADGGAEEFTQLHAPETDKSTSLANWIELHRGLMVLDPGESNTVPVTIHINLHAVPGTYHAVIAFPPGNNRELAEEKLTETGQMFMTLTVEKDIRESLSLLSFLGSFALSSNDPVTLTYEVENGGNTSIEPRGDIIVYDRRGKEIDVLPINTEGLTIPPGESVLLASVWDGASRAGRFKAFLVMEYGTAQLKSLQDTAFFWVVPLPTLAASFALLLISSLWFVNYLHRRSLMKHRVRIDTWHKESTERYGTKQKQRVVGLPESAHRQTESPTPTPIPKRTPKVRGNTIDLRQQDDERA